MEEKKVKELEIDFKDFDNMLELKRENVIYKLKINGLKVENICYEVLDFKLNCLFKEKGFLFDLSETKLPNNLKNMESTFAGCKSLIKAPKIPDSVVDMSWAFAGCKSLVEAPVIPESVVDMSWAFAGCKSLIKAPKIPDSVVDMRWTFDGCENLKEAPVIPEGVEKMNFTFVGCRNLKEAPVIPNGVVNMDNTFYGCEKLNTAKKFQDTFKKLSNSKLSVLDISKEMTSWMNDKEKNKLDEMFKKMGVKSEMDLEKVLLGWKDEFQKELKKDVKIEKKIEKDVRGR